MPLCVAAKPAPTPLPVVVSPEFITLQRAVAGRYSLEREIGRGGMGIVFLARDVALDRLVAIKLLPPALAADAARRTRFLDEARMAARMSHPHIVPIHAVEERDGLVFFVMTYVAGETLGERLRRTGPLPVDEGARVLQEVAWALGHAHARGTIHRDVKPDNVLLEQGSDRALVVDFGIGRITAGTERDAELVGTPHYMSPEQATGEPADARSDIYALGATAYTVLTGRPPFEGSSASAVLARHVSDTPDALCDVNPSVSASLGGVIERCLAKRPQDRYGSADEVAEAIRAARGAGADIAPPLRAFVREADRVGNEVTGSLIAAAVALVVLVAFIGFGEWPFNLIYLLVAAFMVSIAGTRYGQLIATARGLLGEGWGHRAVLPALLSEERRRQEEEETQAHRGLTGRTFAALSVVGAAKTAVAIWLVTAEISEFLTILGVIGSVMIPTAMLRQIWLQSRGRSLWSRLLRGGLGRLTFVTARLGMRGAPPLAPVSGELTVLAVERAAEELYAALPDGQREELRALPSLLERLRAEVLRLRAAGEREHAESAMAALEILRLGLLRLHAGESAVGDLTLNIEAAERIASSIDAMVEDRADAKRLLGTTPDQVF